jgi:release factor glutamine methyltransferase
MTIAEALTTAAANLVKSSSSPRLDAELLLAHVLQTDRPSLILHAKDNVPEKKAKEFSSFIRQRAQHVPIPFLTGRQEFFGMSLEVTPDVLVPRPATELLVEAVIKHLPADTTMTIADVGTGSGAIALALAKHLPNASLIASDVSPAALDVAKKNAERLGLSDRITFLRSSLLTTYNLQPNFIVANLPYLTPSQMNEASIQREPRLALAGGLDGLHLIQQLLNHIATRLTPPGIALEMDPAQIQTVRSMVFQVWPHRQIHLVSDGQADRGLLNF